LFVDPAPASGVARLRPGFPGRLLIEEPRPRTIIVPKMKSKGAVKKRFRMTKSGKLKCSKPKRGHQHAPKDAKTKRNKRKAIVVSGTWAYLLKRMMGGG
jgi:large subunit ribosomal protein L35